MCKWIKYHKYQDIEAEVEATMEKWLPQKLIATIVSRRIDGRDDCVLSRCIKYTHNEQEDGRMKGKGWGKQSLKHIGDVPVCMCNKNKDVEPKAKKIERTRGDGGGRQRRRHVEGDMPMCIRHKGEENEARSKI